MPRERKLENTCVRKPLNLSLFYVHCITRVFDFESLIRLFFLNFLEVTRAKTLNGETQYGGQ
jgi:hypothetical protein